MNTLASVIAHFESRQDTFHELEVHQALKQLPESASPEDEQRIRWEHAAFHFAEDYPDNGTGWGLYFGPMAVLPGPNNTAIEIPSKTIVEQKTISYWLERAQAVKHPLLRNRYADLAWEFGSIVANTKRDASAARIAIDAAVEFASRSETEPMAGRAKLTRALQLSRLISDSQRTTIVITALIEFETRTSEDDLAGTWGYCYDELVDGKQPITDAQEHDIIASLEARFARLLGPDGTAGGDPFAPRDIAARLAAYYRRKNDTEAMHRVVRSSAAPFLRLAKQAMPLLGAEWVRDVYKFYREFGMNEDADALNPLMAELGGRSKDNLRKVTHELKIDQAEIVRLERVVTAATLTESLNRIVLVFLVDPEQAAREMNALAAQFPLQAIFKQVRIDADGKVESEVGGVKDDPQGRLVAQMAQSMGIQAFFLHYALSLVVRTFSATADQIVDALSSSPVFPASQRPFLIRAVEAYINGDWMTFAHVIVPQVENAIRRLVVLRGGSHVKPHRAGGIVYRPLDDLLRDATVGQVLGDKVVHYLQVVLTDQRGLNLRNVVCHGYATAEMFGPQMCDRLLHTVLVLGQLRASESADSSTAPPPTT